MSDYRYQLARHNGRDCLEALIDSSHLDAKGIEGMCIAIPIEEGEAISPLIHNERVVIEIAGQQCEGVLHAQTVQPAEGSDLTQLQAMVRQMRKPFNVSGVFDTSVIDPLLFQLFINPNIEAERQRALREDLRDLRVRRARVQLAIEEELAKDDRDQALLHRLRQRKYALSRQIRRLAEQEEAKT